MTSSDAVPLIEARGIHANYGASHVLHGVFSNLSVRENLVMAARPGPDGRREWTYERVLATFPKEIWAILRQIRDAGIAAIIVDKSRTAASAIADRNVILVKGRVVFKGSSDQLRRSPETLQQHLGI